MATPPWIKTATSFVQDNSTTILSGAAVLGVVGTVILAVKATPDAMENIAAAHEDKVINTPDIEHAVKLTPIEIVKVTWRPFLPTALSGVATISCIIGANAIGLRRNAALAAAFTLVDSAFREYKDKVIETIGGKDEEKIVQTIQEDRVKAATPVGSVIVLGEGEVLCYDMITGRSFKSDAETIRRAVNDTDAQVLDDGYAALNDFYRFVGLDTVLVGEVLGWNVDNRPKLNLGSYLNECNQPCIAVAFQKMPIRDYEKF